MEVLSHAQDLFAYFCSILVRLYLNYAMEHFSELISTIKLSDEKFVIEQILTFANGLLHELFNWKNILILNFLSIMQNFTLIEEIFTFIWDLTILHLVIQILNNF